MTSQLTTFLLASSSDVNVDLDLSFVAQIALFGLFITVLKPLLFDPLLKLFEAREKLTDGARADARRMDERAAALVAKFEGEIETVRREAALERDRLRAETAKLEARMLEEAKADAGRILAAGREQIASEVAALRKDLDAARPALAQQIASRMLAREVGIMRRRPITSVRAAGLLVVALALVGVGDVAFAQPSGQPAAQPPPGQPRPGQPGAQPQPGQPGAQPRPGQPGQPGRPPRMQQPGGRPQGNPPGRPPGRPNLPPGHPVLPGQQPAAPAAQPESHGPVHDCHGPNSPAHHINWYQGLIGVDKEKDKSKNKALSPRFIDRLLYRYYNEKDTCDEKNMEPPVLASVINLGIVIAILIIAGRKPLIAGLAKRKKTIMADIDAANELFVSADKRLKSYQKQLSRIEVRRKELQEEYRSQWETERKRILAETEEKTIRLRKDAEFRVAQELKQAEADLLREAVDGAVAAAHDLVTKRIQPADQERLADEYVTGIAAALASGRRASDERRPT